MACAAVLVPAGARAATITYAGADSGAVVYAADPGEALNTIVGYEPGCVSQGGQSYDCVTFSGDAVTAAPSQCAPAAGRESCVLDLDHSGVHVVGGSGDDRVSALTADISGFPAGSPYRIAIDGGDGDDTLLGGDSNETLAGGAGSDRVTGLGGGDTIDGGDGNDVLGGDSDDQYNATTDGGSDVIHGGPGDDRLTGDGHAAGAAIGHDVLDGGAGTDTVYDDWYRQDGNGGDEDPPPMVTFDGQANDGRPGENDQVVAVEAIDSGYQPLHTTPGVYVGGDGPDAFHLIFTNGQVTAGAGADVVTGGDGADAIDGGPGDDALSGGFGDDRITGGPGRDAIGGDRTAACEYGPIFGSCTIGSGNDTIEARDGEKDTIDCGPGADTAYVDAIDAVAGCESVLLASPSPGGVSPAGEKARKRLPVARLTFGRQRVGRVLRAGAFRLTCRLPRAGRCIARATITARAARALHLRPRRKAKTLTLGSGARTFKKAGAGRVVVRLSRRAARGLRQARSLRVTFRVTASYAAGSRTTTKTVKVAR